MLEAIRRQYDDPMEVAVREFFKKIYGGHPAGAYPTVASVNAITRADLVDFHAAYYAPENATMVVRILTRRDDRALEKDSRRWKVKGIEPPELPPLTGSRAESVLWERPLPRALFYRSSDRDPYNPTIQH